MAFSKPSLRNAVSAVLFLLAGAGVVFTGRASRRVESARFRAAELTQALHDRDLEIARWSEQIKATTERQRQTIREIGARLPESESAECEPPSVEFRYGVGILQVAHVEARQGSASITSAFADNQISRLRALLSARGLAPWGRLLSQYPGRGKEPVRRVVFNNIDADAGAQMCAWLRCENWTGGCGFIDEKGTTHVEQKPTEYEPTEDLFQSWKVARASGVGLPPLVPNGGT